MRNLHSDSERVRVDNQLAGDHAHDAQRLPNRLLTAREVARFVGCHEETVRRAYWRGLLRSQRFGVRGSGGFTQMTSSTGFHRFGVTIRTKEETKRDRRIGLHEEQALLAASGQMGGAEHKYVGSAMHDRIIGALET